MDPAFKNTTQTLQSVLFSELTHFQSRTSSCWSNGSIQHWQAHYQACVECVCLCVCLCVCVCKCPSHSLPLRSPSSQAECSHSWAYWVLERGENTHTHTHSSPSYRSQNDSHTCLPLMVAAPFSRVPPLISSFGEQWSVVFIANPYKHCWQILSTQCGDGENTDCSATHTHAQKGADGNGAVCLRCFCEGMNDRKDGINPEIKVREETKNSRGMLNNSSELHRCSSLVWHLLKFLTTHTRANTRMSVHTHSAIQIKSRKSRIYASQPVRQIKACFEMRTFQPCSEEIQMPSQMGELQRLGRSGDSREAALLLFSRASTVRWDSTNTRQ